MRGKSRLHRPDHRRDVWRHVDRQALFIEHTQEDSEFPEPNQRVSLLRYARFRSFWAMCLGWCGFNGVFYGLLTWGPLYLSETKHFNIQTIGYSTLVIYGAGFVGELVGGYVADRWRGTGASTYLIVLRLPPAV